MIDFSIRPATAQDATAITDIQNHYILHTPFNLHIDPFAAADTERNLQAANANKPYLVAVADGAVIGFAYADILRGRCGYQYAFENSVYVHPDAIQKGVGKALLGALLDALRAGKAHKVVAVLTLPNDASVGLHEKFGFVRCGVLPAIGWKFNKWWDNGYWVLDLKKGAPSDSN